MPTDLRNTNREISRNTEKYQQICWKAKLALTVPVTNASPERGGSTIKRIKTRNRCSMKNDLQMLC